MANDFIKINLDANNGEPARALYDAVKQLRLARETLTKVRAWMLHSFSGNDYNVLETRFCIPAGSGADAFQLVDGTLQVLDGTSSGYANDLLGRVGSSSS